jgi:hypothetical protein
LRCQGGAPRRAEDNKWVVPVTCTYQTPDDYRSRTEVVIEVTAEVFPDGTIECDPDTKEISSRKFEAPPTADEAKSEKETGERLQNFGKPPRK